MLHLIPAGLHRAGLNLAHELRKRWWRLAKPALSGVTVIARDDSGRVLLVRHSYGSGRWTLPGGGIRAGEEPLAAARREVAEELGCALDEAVLVGLHRGTLHGAPVKRHIVAGRLSAELRPDGREVAQARFFARDALPDGCAAIVTDALQMLK